MNEKYKKEHHKVIYTLIILNVFVQTKKKVLYNGKHKFIKNTMAQKQKPKYKLNKPIYTR